MSDAPATAAAPELSPAVAPQAARHPGRAAAWLGLLSAVTLGIVGLSPFWAPSVMPLLPWGVAPVAAPDGTATAIPAIHVLMCGVWKRGWTVPK